MFLACPHSCTHPLHTVVHFSGCKVGLYYVDTIVQIMYPILYDITVQTLYVNERRVVSSLSTKLEAGSLSAVSCVEPMQFHHSIVQPRRLFDTGIHHRTGNTAEHT